ncbi:putative membrane protein [Mycobacterium kansasii]|uniref:Putative membrane protein n=1 Tax=Mycobacterium kansasii TaxID=1768 RepID=A0A1V3X289_MYCKA|nr:putative membrane protein [Mycobacterium kansasii]
MDVKHPEQDPHWDQRRRGETELQRLDRNWNSLLQELRVVQTGVQLLTGFLLTLPFQQRFDTLTLHGVYLATVGCSVAATVLLIAPVGMHRLLFRRHRLVVLVSAAHRCAYAGLVLLGLALTGVTVIIFDAVSGQPPASSPGPALWRCSRFSGCWFRCCCAPETCACRTTDRPTLGVSRCPGG